MLLPSQKKVHNLKQEESRKAIEQGTALAISVDELRNRKLKEEKELTEQRNSLVSELHKELDKLNDKILSEKSLLAKLRTEQSLAQKPLDEEWAKLRESEKALKDKQKALDDELTVTIKKNKILDRQIEQTDQNIRDTQARLKEAETVLFRKEAMFKETVHLSDLLTLEIEKFNQKKAQYEIVTANREKRLFIRERELELRRDGLNERERELNLNQTYANSTVKR